MNTNALSRRMATSSRAALLMVSRYPSSYGRQWLRSQAIEELCHRAILQFAPFGCGRKRAERVSNLITGRQRQLIGPFGESAFAERAWHFDPIVQNLALMRTLIQAQVAAEAMDEVLSSTALASLPPQSHDAPSMRETGIEMDLYKYPDSHYHFSRHKK